MNKIYIFLTTNIKTAGGTQCYTAAKASYLESQGWRVIILSASYHPKKIKSPISSLEKYVDGNFEPLCISPYKLPFFVVKRTLKKIQCYVGEVNSDDEIIIESHEDSYSQWGELIAAKLNARHYFYLMNEFYRQPFQTYVNKMNFYTYKFGRKEILGTQKFFMRLFDGYLNFPPNVFPPDAVIDESPIQNVLSEKIEQIAHDDWNICYIGRGNKTYVPSILKGITDFAKRHQSHVVQFIAIGDLDIHRSSIDKILSETNNLKIIELGLMHPIPRSLFAKVDVVIAGAGSARHSAEEGALVLIADTETCLCNGLLGYETTDATYRTEDSVVSDFCSALERVLVEKNYLSLSPKSIFQSKNVADCVKQNFELFDQADKNKEYYPEEELLKGNVDIPQIIKYYLYYYHPSFYASMIRMKKFLRGKK